ncbi:MAG: hypothetical protein HC831_01260 [Chloroflexia bacterium]|nr:hypothetical protein [Chloroflexia bacterium]
MKNPAEKQFCYSTVLVEESIVETDKDEFQPQYSPDGNEVAYLEERTTINIKNLQTGKIRMVFDGSRQYSYADGDQKFEWSPNGNWLLYSSENNLFLSNIYLVDAKTFTPPIDLTQSGYNDTKPKWGMNGEMFIWTSDKESMRKQAVWWGAQADIYAGFFNQKAYDIFKLSDEDYNVADKQSLTYSFDEKSADFKNVWDRKLKLTTDAKIITDLHLTKDGKSLFYLVSTPEQHELWVTNTRTKTSKMATNFPGSGNTGSLWKNKSDGTKISTDKDDKNIYAFIKGSIYKVDAKTYKMSKISYNASMTVDKAKERQYLFEHVWLQVAKKFYNTNLHNVDWKFYKSE